MKAIVHNKYGGPEVLQLAEVPKPVPKKDEVLVKVYAASINDWDMGRILGEPKFFRLFTGISSPKQKIQGSDIAGRVEAVGKEVTEFKEGDMVYGDLSGRWGGFAEYVCAREKAICRMPAAMSFEVAAATPQAAMLAIQGLIDKGKIKEGQKLLINGAGGGVGTFGIQIARLYKAESTAVDSSAKLSKLKSLGFHHVIDYTRENFTRNGKKYDLILDTKTNRSVLSYLRSLNKNGVYVTVGGSMLRLLQALFYIPWIHLFSGKRIKIVVLKPNKDLSLTNQLFESEKLEAVIDGPYSMNSYKNAFNLYYKAEHIGKVVIRMME